MELVGDEKRIQALFSELKFQDQSIAPSFDRMWISVPQTNPKRMAFMHPMVVLATLALFGAICVVALSSKQASKVDISSAPDAAPAVTSIAADVEPPKKLSRRSRRTIVRRTVRHVEPEHVLIQQAAVLSNWQSPTISLMESANSSLVTSLPEFNQTVKDLQSYLSIDGVKELK